MMNFSMSGNPNSKWTFAQQPQTFSTTSTQQQPQLPPLSQMVSANNFSASSVIGKQFHVPPASQQVPQFSTQNFVLSQPVSAIPSNTKLYSIPMSTTVNNSFIQPGAIPPSSSQTSNHINSLTTPQSSYTPSNQGVIVPSSSNQSKKSIVQHDVNCLFKSNKKRIPRPRNAFILFRQHHHQQVLDEENKIKTNPDVSRELGKRWRSLSQSEKDYWNQKAEDEKRMHNLKYPNYKYIPRRNSKNNNCPACKAKELSKITKNGGSLNSTSNHSSNSASINRFSSSSLNTALNSSSGSNANMNFQSMSSIPSNTMSSSTFLEPQTMAFPHVISSTSSLDTHNNDYNLLLNNINTTNSNQYTVGGHTEIEDNTDDQLAAATTNNSSTLPPPNSNHLPSFNSATTMGSSVNGYSNSSIPPQLPSFFSHNSGNHGFNLQPLSAQSGINNNNLNGQLSIFGPPASANSGKTSNQQSIPNNNSYVVANANANKSSTLNTLFSS